MRLLTLLAATAMLAGCSGGDDRPPDPPAPVSRGADGDCVKAWNSPGNAANRATAAAAHTGWSVWLGRWSVDHPKPSPSGDDLVGDGCSYFFSSATHWRSYSGGWEADGDLRWNMPDEARGRRTPEQQVQPANAVMEPSGKLSRLAADDGSAVSPREWRAVIDDWYADGAFDEPHRCAAVRAALEQVPIGGSDVITVREDLVEYAELVC